ncbi:Omp28-related outer membrane protein [Leyella stercorea]|uniref:Omp28-related outer membrane protein n=1 Tax=Leyella stercorea TaxID=363265 RepID=UPI003AF7685A
MNRKQLIAIVALLAMMLCLPMKAAKTYWGYCNGVDPVAFGTKNTGKCAIYIPADVAQVYKGFTVSAVKYGLAAQASNVEVFITKDLNADPIVTKKATVSTIYKGWNEVALTTPYEIDGEGFYIGYSYSASAVSMGVTSTFSENACWADLGDGWKNYAVEKGESAKALAIQARITGDNLPLDLMLYTEQKDIAVQKGEPCKFDFSVKNLSAVLVRNLQVGYSIDGGEETVCDFKTAMGSNIDKTFTIEHDGFDVVGNHTLKLRVVSINGKDDVYAPNSELVLGLNVKNSLPIQRIIVEEGTGTWCPNCPRGIVAIHKASEAFPDRFIGIAVHKQDALETNSYAELQFAAYPDSYINRNLKSSVQPSFDAYKTAVNAVSEKVPVMGVDANVKYTDANKQKISVEAFTTFLSAHKGMNYRLSFVLLEDCVKGYTQANNYAGGSVEMGGFEKLSNPATIDMDHVARMNYSYNGIEGSIPADVEAFETTRYTTTLDVPSTIQNPDNCDLVVLVLDANTGRIENAVKVELGKHTTDIYDAEQLLIPDFSFQGDRLNVDGFSGSVRIFTTGGVEVANSNLAPGMYIVKATAGNQTVTRKLIKR